MESMREDTNMREEKHMRKKYVRYAAVLSACVLGVNSISVSPVNAKAVSTLEMRQYADTDKDGLEDYLEEYFGTDKKNADTDKDGISDYMEIMVLDTNPLKADSDLDTDGDGLSNKEEIRMGTDPVKADTDSDGLTDGEEADIYHTDPLKSDTDGDGLSDGEEISLKLNPLKTETTKAKKDSKKLFQQTLDKENIEEALRNKSNKAIPSLSGSVPGVMEHNVSVERSTVVVEKLENAKVGEPVEVVSDYNNAVSMNLSFTCNKSSTAKLKNCKIGKYENGKLTYLKTSIKNKKLTARIQSGGTYLVVDTAAKRKTQPVKAMALSYTDTDSDYDGIPDNLDKAPQDNSFSGVIHNPGFDIDSHVAYAIDYRAFFKPSSEFNSQLCKASSIYANMGYEFTMSDERSGKDYSITELMSYQGLSNTMAYDLKSLYSDYDLTKFFIGHRTVTYNGVTKNVIAVSVQGTGGGMDQWQSNFDIGTTADFYKYPDWTTIENHRGFDIAANRAKKLIESYVKSYCSNGSETVYWLTGHSRGAAIANIISAKLIDEGKTAYGYTFASPNTTTKANAATSQYSSIFNLVNQEDFVPCLPCAAWNFRRYGRTSVISISKNYEKEWEDLTGIFDYNPDTFGMDDTVNELGAVFQTRNQAYIYTCKCHGTGTKDDITIRNYGTSKKSRENAIAKIPFNALPYGKITRYDGTWFWGWDFTVCQCPQYFMQILASVMAGQISNYRFVAELNIADHYESAKTAIIKSAIGGLTHPHYSESYYILSKHAQASDFSY